MTAIALTFVLHYRTVSLDSLDLERSNFLGEHPIAPSTDLHILTELRLKQGKGSSQDLKLSDSVC